MATTDQNKNATVAIPFLKNLLEAVIDCCLLETADTLVISVGKNVRIVYIYGVEKLNRQNRDVFREEGITDLVVVIPTAILLLLTEKKEVGFVTKLNGPSELVSRIFLNTII
jgi:hypothetical protein